MENKTEQSRITLAIAFIATYLTLVFGLSEKIKPSFNVSSIITDVIWYIFVVYGVIVALIFFLYLSFTALKLNFSKKKEIKDWEITEERIEEIRKKLFNWGVGLIFFSFFSPVFYLYSYFEKVFGFWIAIILGTVCFVISELLLIALTRKKK